GMWLQVAWLLCASSRRPAPGLGSTPPASIADAGLLSRDRRGCEAFAVRRLLLDEVPCHSHFLLGCVHAVSGQGREDVKGGEGPPGLWRNGRRLCDSQTTE